MTKKKLIYISIIFLLLIILIIVSITTFFKLTSKSYNEHVFSHRGASGEEIEHTLAAYDLAIMYGSKYIEPDVVTSKDNTLFISHDPSAKKITGHDQLYKDMTDKEIKRLTTENGESILSLDELFSHYGKSVNYVVELKENDNQVELFKEVVDKHNIDSNVIVQASTVSALEKINIYYPSMKKLLLVGTVEQIESNLNNPAVDIFGMYKPLMTEDNITQIHNHNKKANVWTLNSSKEIIEAINLNVDSYFTNFTGKALLLEKKYR